MDGAPGVGHRCEAGASRWMQVRSSFFLLPCFPSPPFVVCLRDLCVCVGKLTSCLIISQITTQRVNLHPEQRKLSVSDLLKPLADITSDPAHLAFIRDLHSQSTLAALGHTVESIKLPPDMRDRKRKRGGKVAGGQRNQENSLKERIGAPIGGESGKTAAASSSANANARQVVNQTLTGPEDIVMAEPNVAQDGPVPMQFPVCALRGGGRTRKEKGRAEMEEVSPGRRSRPFRTAQSN
jgi:hypothetical protein